MTDQLKIQLLQMLAKTKLDDIERVLVRDNAGNWCEMLFPTWRMDSPESDTPTEDFINEMIVLDETCMVSINELWEEYCIYMQILFGSANWGKINSYNVAGNKWALGKKLKEGFPDILTVKRYNPFQKQTENIYKGIRLIKVLDLKELTRSEE